MLVVEKANQEYVRALARAFSAVDNNGAEEEWQLWLPMATAIFESLPHDYCMIGQSDMKILQNNRGATDPARVAIVTKIVKGVRQLLIDFLDPRQRAISLGLLSQSVTELDKYDFTHDDRKNGHR